MLAPHDGGGLLLFSGTADPTALVRFVQWTGQGSILADEDLGSGTTGAKLNQILAEASRLLDQPFDLRDRVVGCAHHREPAAVAEVEDRRDVVRVADRVDRQDVPEVARELQDAELDVATG